MADEPRPPRRAEADRTGQAQAASGGYANSGVHIGSVYSYPRARSRYREQVRQIAPPELVGRDEELAELAAFCVDGPPYAWWRATKWAGKSALMAWFVLHPPAGVRVVSFFVTGRLAGQDHRGAFVDVVLEQLAELLGEPLPTFLPEVTREHHLVGMFAEAAELCRGKGEQLVLVVDGLDEDRGAGGNSIAALLPVKPPDGMRVIVAGRPNPPVPVDVDRDHPLRDPGIVRPLTTSPAARVIRDDMELELDRLLSGTPAEQDLLGLLTAAAGGLSGADLAELTESTPAAIRRNLRAVAARSFETRPGHWQGPDVYLLGHEELQATAEEEFGAARLGQYRERLHTWADGYRARGWPAGTPEYLLRGYFRMLVASGDLPRMAGCATDPGRHDRLLDLSGGDLDAIGEIAACQEAVLAQDDPDLVAMARLAVHRDRLIERNSNIPRELPALWALLGQQARAEALVRMIPDLLGQGSAAVSLTRTLAAQGELTAAREVAKSIVLTGQQAEAMITLIRPLVQRGETATPRQVADSMPSPDWRVEALVAVADALLDHQEPRQAAFCLDAAEEIASAIPAPYRRAEALICVAGGLVAAGEFDRAKDVLQEINAHGRGIDGRVRMVGAAVAKLAFDHAVQWAKEISSQEIEVQMLSLAAQAVAISGDAARALDLITDAQTMVEGRDESDLRAETSSALVGAMITVGSFAPAEARMESITSPSRRDEVLLTAVETAADIGEVDRAESLASKISGSIRQAAALVAVAKARFAAGQPEQARDLAVKAEMVTRSVVDTDARTRDLIAVVHAVEQAGDLRRAHDLALRVADIARPSEDLVRCVAEAGGATKAFALIARMSEPRDRIAALLGLERPLVVAEHIDDVRTWIDQLEDTVGGYEAIASVAEQLAPTDLSEALAFVRSIDHGNERMAASILVIRKLVEAGRPTEAIPVLDTLDHPYWLAQGMVELAGVPDVADRIERITQPEWRARVCTAFASARLDKGETQRARQFLDQAVLWADRIDNPFGQARALTQVVASMTAPRHAAARRDLARRAETVAQLVPHPGRRAEILAYLGKTLAMRGEIDHAEHVAATIGNPGRQAEVLAALVKALAAAGELDRAEAVAVTITQTGRQAEALVRLVKRHTDLDRAAAVAEMIPSPEYQAEAFAWLVGRGLPLVGRIQRLLPSVSSRYRRTQVIRDVAEAGGETFALSITDPEDQATAWLALARHQPGRAAARVLHLRHWREALGILPPDVVDVIVTEVFAE